MPKYEKITFREKVGYGLGDAASNLFWTLLSMYLLFFYTDIFEISAAAAGTMFLITRVWDSLFDPVVGIISDRTNTRWGKFRPYILWIAIPLCVMAVLTFLTPDLSPGGKLLYAYITYSLMMMAYSLINVPYASLLGVISADPRERTALSSYRMSFAFGGSILALVMIEPLVRFFGGNGTQPAAGWSITVVVYSLLALLFFAGTFFWTKERVKPIKNTGNTLREDVGDLLRNRPWWILLGAGIAILIFNSIRNGAAVYYFKYYADTPQYLELGIFGGGLTVATVYLVLGQAANILGILCVTPVAGRIGKKGTFLFATLLVTAFSVAFYFIGRSNMAAMFTLQILISACAGAVMPLLWSMYADVADYSEWKTGRRATGLIFSSSSMSQKFGWSIGGALTGWLLACFGFEANAVQNTEAMEGIRMMLSLLPAAGALISVLFIVFYPLNPSQSDEITKQLDAKRNK